LLFRIGNILRRARPRSGVAGVTQAVRFGPFEFHAARGELRREGEPIHLTERERDILKALAETGGGALSRAALADLHSGSNDRTVDVQVNRLRRKIERDAGEPIYLQTVRGVGYRLAIDL
jgi:two-component system, OmpR family, phosphate regulon response regulator OmpR